jgi:hypothetical protein
MSKDCGGTVSAFHLDQIDICIPFESMFLGGRVVCVVCVRREGREERGERGERERWRGRERGDSKHRRDRREGEV